jgi:hypothetical protein
MEEQSQKSWTCQDVTGGGSLRATSEFQGARYPRCGREESPEGWALGGCLGDLQPTTLVTLLALIRAFGVR